MMQQFTDSRAIVDSKMRSKRYSSPPPHGVFPIKNSYIRGFVDKICQTKRGGIFGYQPDEFSVNQETSYVSNLIAS